MTQSVELLPDADAEAHVRADWRLLDEAGLASQARHRSPSNRPHVTLAAVPQLTSSQEEEIAAVCRDHLPLAAFLGPLGVFGRDPVVLVRLVMVNAELLGLHTRVAASASVDPARRGAPGRWVPHVTLAHRMPREQVTRALAMLGSDDVPVSFVHARRWDAGQRLTWTIPEGPHVARGSRPG